MQLVALKEAERDESHVFTEKVSGVGEHTELQTVMKYIHDGDFLIVYKLDRLGISTKNLLTIIEQLQTKNVRLMSLSDNIDTSSISGKLIMHIFTILAEFERYLIKERTEEGRRETKKKGGRFGRPKQPKPERSSMCAQLYPMVIAYQSSCVQLVLNPGTLYISISAWKA
jgi:DNA invertase Pin-like site-specific DNA recombinase